MNRSSGTQDCFTYTQISLLFSVCLKRDRLCGHVPSNSLDPVGCTMILLRYYLRFGDSDLIRIHTRPSGRLSKIHTDLFLGTSYRTN